MPAHDYYIWLRYQNIVAKIPNLSYEVIVHIAHFCRAQELLNIAQCNEILFAELRLLYLERSFYEDYVREQLLTYCERELYLVQQHPILYPELYEIEPDTTDSE